MTRTDDIRRFQEAGHGPGHDYEHGSPHLMHAGLRTRVTTAIVEAVRRAAGPDGVPRVLEIGAGHGSLTAALVDAGARVVVTEMSEPSAAELERRFTGVEAVTVVHDPDGEVPVEGEFDAVVYVSVLHHIPDYLAAVERSAARLQPGGALISFQDPLWYPRRSRSAVLTTRAIYLAWRLGQGEFRRGVATMARRLRGVYDESQPSDMVEYHMVRDGVDEQALVERLGPLFDRVRLVPYWSIQPSWGQRFGERFLAPNTFGLVAEGRVPDGHASAGRPGTS
jgi:SAM-dependent methyltransferase